MHSATNIDVCVHVMLACQLRTGQALVDAWKEHSSAFSFPVLGLGFGSFLAYIPQMFSVCTHKLAVLVLSPKPTVAASWSDSVILPDLACVGLAAAIGAIYTMTAHRQMHLSLHRSENALLLISLVCMHESKMHSTF